jgi:hypothetical protein
MRRERELTDRVKQKLLSGHWFDFLEGERVSDAELRDAWGVFRKELLAAYAPPSWCEDRPCWAEYVYELVPRFGRRLGLDPDEAVGGYFVDERDAESWRSYCERIGR